MCNQDPYDNRKLIGSGGYNLFICLSTYCLLNKFEHILISSDLQFGFKRKFSCTHAIFLLKQVTEYFITHGSNVYMAALDAKKAFDRVNHVKLFNILLNKGLPGRFIKVLIDWYGKSFAFVKWNNVLSNSVLIKSGIRQGGILSPVLLNIYLDQVFYALKKSDLGCHIGSTFGYNACADDNIIVISASVIQNMINICYTEGAKLDILFNPKKSLLFKVGKVHTEQLVSLTLGNQPIFWVDRLKYLGLCFVSAKSFNVDVSINIRKCYAAANSIFKRCNSISEIMKLHCSLDN